MASDIRKNYFRASYLFIMKFILKYSDKKRQGIHWSTLKVHCARCKATLYLAAKVESLVTDVLICFRYCFHRIVGLVVINIRQ